MTTMMIGKDVDDVLDYDRLKEYIDDDVDEEADDDSDDITGLMDVKRICCSATGKIL
ncbi:hypothetical protein NW754_015056 [Fusarium falciforme]|nr:hypothetical protein NW754_015056 [Fusarium falciforme]